VTDTYSPAAIDMAPATSPATPAIRTVFGVGAAAATPTIKLAVETIPSLAPSTAARSHPIRPTRWCSGCRRRRLIRPLHQIGKRVTFCGCAANAKWHTKNRSGPMSALGQKQIFAPQKAMSALPPKADMCGALAHVCLVPIADIAPFTRSLRQHGRSRSPGYVSPLPWLF
jgi:hypothetical protein